MSIFAPAIAVGLVACMTPAASPPVFVSTSTVIVAPEPAGAPSDPASAMPEATRETPTEAPTETPTEAQTETEAPIEALTVTRGPQCGAVMRLFGADHDRVRFEFENITDHTIVIGSSSNAAFVDAHHNSLEAGMSAADDDWFMSFKLMAGARKQTALVLSGDATALDRMEVPDSGDARMPTCTLTFSGLARREGDHVRVRPR